jgi:hypothetical protein
MLRYERKYRLDDWSPPVVEQIIRMHPASFYQPYPPRWVNNIYFDTPSFTSFKDNVAGISQRVKHRMRWYGRPFYHVDQPVLEAKIKHNETGRKESIRLGGTYTLENIQELTQMARDAWNKGNEFGAVLLNTYHRSYWISANQKFRLTIDYQLQYSPVTERKKIHLDYNDRSTVVEVKYPIELDDESGTIFQYLPFRQTKNSKYVNGISWVYGG